MTDLVGGSVQLEWDLQRSPLSGDRLPVPLALIFRGLFEYRRVQVFIPKFMHHIAAVTNVRIYLSIFAGRVITDGRPPRVLYNGCPLITKFGIYQDRPVTKPIIQPKRKDSIEAAIRYQSNCLQVMNIYPIPYLS